MVLTASESPKWERAAGLKDKAVITNNAMNTRTEGLESQREDLETNFEGFGTQFDDLEIQRLL